MDQKLRERLNRIVGTLEGISWGIENSGIVECIMHVQEELDEILEEEK